MKLLHDIDINSSTDLEMAQYFILGRINSTRAWTLGIGVKQQCDAGLSTSAAKNVQCIIYTKRVCSKIPIKCAFVVVVFFNQQVPKHQAEIYTLTKKVHTHTSQTQIFIQYSKDSIQMYTRTQNKIYLYANDNIS